MAPAQPPGTKPPLEDALDRQDAIADALEAVFDAVGAYIDEAHLQSLVASRAVDDCLGAALAAVDAAYMAREDAALLPGALARGSWDVDVQPAPCGLDTWARGAVPRAARRAEEAEPRAGRAMQASRTMRAPPASRREGEPHAGTAIEEEPSTAAKDDPTSGKRQPGRPYDSSMSRVEREEIEESLREEISLRRQQAQVAQKTKQEDEKDRSKLEALQKELRGKEYTYDHRGQVVVMNRLNAARLPSPTAAPSVQLIDPADEEEAEAPAKKGQKGTKGGERLASKAAAASARSKGVPDFMEKPNEAQPSAMETMRLARGVVLKQGGSTKAGPPRKPTPGQMTKQEYNRYIQRQNAQARRSGTKGSSRQSTPSKPPPAESAPGPGAQARDDPATGADARAAASLFSKNGKRTTGPPEWIKDGRPKEAKGEEVVRQESLNADLYLANAPDWGSSSVQRGAPPPDPPAVAKPSAVDIQRTVGRKKRLPRTRAAHATIAPPLKLSAGSEDRI